MMQNEKRRVYDGMEIVQERDVNNVTTASLTRTGNIGGILARTTNAGSVFYGYDGSGNVVTLTNSSGAEVGSYTYDAWGNIAATSGVAAGENPYRFSTKEQIGGLYSYGFRFYSPGLGRWINRDPIGEAGGINLYGFVGNDPMNRVDEYGEFANLIAGAVGSVATGWVIAKVTGDCYSWKDAALDAATGAAGVGLFNKARKLYRLRKLMSIANKGGLVKKASQKGTQEFVGDFGTKLTIKHVGNVFRPNSLKLNPQHSWVPRARLKLFNGTSGNPAPHFDPFTGATGVMKSPVGHIPLHALPFTEAPLIGAAQGIANSVSRKAAGDCGCD